MSASPDARMENVGFAVAIAGCLLIFVRRRTAGMFAILFAAAIFASGCGHGSVPPIISGGIQYADVGTYHFTITAASTTGTPFTQTVTATVNITAR